ncbi:Ig-like domain-containing protein [Butyribacter sp.]|uniref:Ig-like domain-containing protein n=1 Tax=Butyribacter sp. TaxID=2822465 RepID=UPI002A9311EC|nr:Ig-like domain-containing protein [Butyribacter sp.]
MKKAYSKKILSIVVAAAMVITGIASGAMTRSFATAAAKKASVSFKSSSYTVQEGKTLGLKGKIIRKNVSKVKSMTWSSKNTKIAKVSKNGTVIGIKAGTAKIVCKVKYQV